MTKKILTLLLLFITLVSSAQENTATGPQMADTFRAEGKIYVVISVIAIIFIAIVIFLISLERKIKKLENEIKDNKAGN